MPPPKPAPNLTTISRLPALLRNRTRIATTAGSTRKRPAAAVILLIAAPLAIAAWSWKHHSSVALPTLPQTSPRVAPAAPAPPHVQPPDSDNAPYNGNFGAAAPVKAFIPSEAFNYAARAIEKGAALPSGALRDLQVSLGKFGIFDQSPDGQPNAATRKSYRSLALITGMPVTDVPSATAALRIAESRAQAMLWVLGVFPFGNTLPSWLLASLDESAITSIADAFNQHAQQGPPTFSVRVRGGLIVRARLIPEGTDRRCYGFSAMFERGPLRHHVISRACRISADHWAMAAGN